MLFVSARGHGEGGERVVGTVTIGTVPLVPLPLPLVPLPRVGAVVVGVVAFGAATVDDNTVWPVRLFAADNDSCYDDTGIVA